MKTTYYILNIAICSVSLSTKQQDMYVPFLGDMNTVDSFVKSLSKLNKYAGKADFSNLTSLYLTWFTGTEQRCSGRNKQIIFELLCQYAEAIRNDPDDKYFIFFIHAHGYRQTAADLYNIKIDHNCTVPQDEYLSGTEILSRLRPVLATCNIYLILNTCFSGAIRAINFTDTMAYPSHSRISFSDVDALRDLKSAYFLKILGMSSSLIMGNQDMENTFGISILKSIFEMGIDLSDKSVFDLFELAIRRSNLKHYYPSFISIQNSALDTHDVCIRL